MRFDWHNAKAAANLEKHEFSFEEAATIFADANALDGRDVPALDRRTKTPEDRALRVSTSADSRVCSEELENEATIRIVSARQD